MKRLTERDEFGNADIIGVDSADLQLNLDFEETNRVTEALNLLAAYEDIGEPDELIKPVRCSECVKFYDGDCMRASLACDYFPEREPDDYCSYGKLKEETQC